MVPKKKKLPLHLLWWFTPVSHLNTQEIETGGLQSVKSA